jgi:hypothetical protein
VKRKASYGGMERSDHGVPGWGVESSSCGRLIELHFQFKLFAISKSKSPVDSCLLWFQDRQPACQVVSKPDSQLSNSVICNFVIGYRKPYVECCTKIDHSHKCWTVPGIDGAREPLCHFNSFSIYSLLFLVAHTRI